MNAHQATSHYELMTKSCPSIAQQMSKPSIQSAASADQLSTTDLLQECLQKFEQLVQCPTNEVECVIGNICEGFSNVDLLYRNSNHFRRFLIEKVMPKIPQEPWQAMKILADDLTRHERDDQQKEERLRKLETKMKKILLRIKKLDEEEVDTSDEENSSYIQAARYKKKLMRVSQEISDLKNYTGTEEMITFSGTNIPALDKAIEQYINNNEDFPNYQGVLKIVNATNNIQKLGLMETQIPEIAENAFRKLRAEMKRQRQLEHSYMLSSYLDSTDWKDPALEDPELNRKLLENQKIGAVKMEEVINKFVERQYTHDPNDIEDIDTDEE